nr:uncharacterized protein LOC104644679 [Solanum lycopersicum]
MNPPEFLGSQANEDSYNFIDEIKKIIMVMQVTINDRVKLESYQLKDVGHIRFFPIELRKSKAQEFMNLRQSNMTFQEYALKFNQLSRYAPHMVADYRARGDSFGTSGCQRQNSLYALQARQDQKGSPDVVTASGDRVSNPKFKKGKGTNSPNGKPTCGKCGKKHYGDFLKRTDNFFSCGKSGHNIRDCPNMKSQDKGSGQDQATDPCDALKKNYNLRSRSEKDTSPTWCRHVESFLY